MVEKVINFLLIASKVVDQFDFGSSIVNQDQKVSFYNYVSIELIHNLKSQFSKLFFGYKQGRGTCGRLGGIKITVL